MANTPVNSKNDEKKAANEQLVGEKGRTSIEDSVVSKIAGIATREVTGVYDLGSSMDRLAGSVRDFIPGASANVSQGIEVEVGEKQAAVDVSVIAEYGVAIHELAEAVRQNIINSVERMTGLEVTEVNVDVTDVHTDYQTPQEREEQAKKELEKERKERQAAIESTNEPAPRVQ